MVRAVRGAISLEKDTEQELKRCVCALYDEILNRNDLNPEDFISIIFSQTKDISFNPAKALRLERQLSETPLFCTQEPECVDFKQNRMLRLMISYNAESSGKAVPVYMGRAAELRGDVSGESS